MSDQHDLLVGRLERWEADHQLSPYEAGLLRDAIAAFVRRGEDVAAASTANAELEARVAELKTALDRIAKAHAPAEHLQEIARVALAGKGQRDDD